MIYEPKNWIRIAVNKCGGATRAAHLTGVCNASVYEWVQKKRIPNIDKARLVAQASGLELELLRSTE